jgi:hypothetical protein
MGITDYESGTDTEVPIDEDSEPDTEDLLDLEFDDEDEDEDGDVINMDDIDPEAVDTQASEC